MHVRVRVPACVLYVGNCVVIRKWSLYHLLGGSRNDLVGKGSSIDSNCDHLLARGVTMKSDIYAYA